MSFLFVATHLYAGGSILIDCMSENERIKSCGHTGFIYHSPPDLISLKERINKSKPTSGITYVDELVYNSQIASKHFYNYCKWIYLIREPESTLKYLVKKYTPENAEKYYSFRLRRLCEMAVRTPDALILHYEDIFNGNAIWCIEKYLDLKINCSKSMVEEEIIDIPRKVLKRATSSWVRYNNFLKSLPVGYRSVRV